MIKYIDLSPFDENGDPTTRQVGSLRMQKIASHDSLMQEMREYIAGIVPKSGKAFLLVAAMGDQNWGPNRNADFWPTEALSHSGHDYGYLTFEDNGHWYHHHNNKDPKKSYGRVVKSLYNPQMARIELIVEVDLIKDNIIREKLENNEVIQVSMGCFVKGTPILMADKNYRPIETVKKGDKVMGHDGKEHIVLSTSTRPYSGGMCAISIQGKPNIVCTEDHPIYVIRAEDTTERGKPDMKCASWVKAKNVCSHDFAVVPVWDGGEPGHVRFKKVEQFFDATVVYNIEVEDSNSYIVHGIAVHNSHVSYDICKVCHPEWEQFYKIPEEDMVRIAKSESLDEVHKIGEKHGVDLSYITKLNPDGGPIGIHSKISKYCDHMRYHRNKLLPNGARVCVINLRPKFFDISYVDNNADKSAFILDKVASNNNDDDDAIHERLMYNEKKAKSEKNADIDKEVPGEVVSVNSDDIKEYYDTKIIPELVRCEKEMPDRVIDDAARKYTLAEILSTFMAMGMFPHPREFQRIVLIQSGDNKGLMQMNDPGMTLTNSMLPRIEQMVGQLPSYDFGISPANVHPVLGRMLEQYVPHRSYATPIVAKRIIMIKSAGVNEVNAYMDNTPSTNPIPTLLTTIGGIYLAAKLTGNSDLNSLVDMASNNKLKVMAGLAGAVIIGKAMQSHGKEMQNNAKYNQWMEYNKQMRMDQRMQKHAAWSGAKTVVLPLLGSYLYAGHATNQMQRGEDPGGLGRFVAQHPFASGMGAVTLSNPTMRKAIFGKGKAATNTVSTAANPPRKPVTFKDVLKPTATIAAPIIATHAVAANTMNKANNGEEYNKVEEFVTKHPVATGVAGGAVLTQPIRSFLSTIPAYIAKGASLQDVDMSGLNPIEQNVALCLLNEYLDGAQEKT